MCSLNDPPWAIKEIPEYPKILCPMVHWARVNDTVYIIFNPSMNRYLGLQENPVFYPPLTLKKIFFKVKGGYY
jgi:hypothetical protein